MPLVWDMLEAQSEVINRKPPGVTSATRAVGKSESSSDTGPITAHLMQTLLYQSQSEPWLRKPVDDPGGEPRDNESTRLVSVLFADPVLWVADHSMRLGRFLRLTWL